MVENQETIGGRYQVLGRLGKGAMGVVFMAYDPVLDRKVAIKQMGAEIARNEDLRQRFYVEARAAARLNHPHIITIHELQESGGEIYMVMEMLEGQPVAALIEGRATPLPMETTLDIMAQVCDGLEYAHQHAIVHRDIKPANLFVTTSGVVKILDFGIARLGSLHMTATGAMVGTPDYMSPEQIRGDEIDRRTDVWAAGAVLYQLLSGSKPFEGRPLAKLLMAITHTPHVPLQQRAPALPRAVCELVDRLLSKPRDQRPATAGVVRDELRAILGRESARSPVRVVEAYEQTLVVAPGTAAPAAVSAAAAPATPPVTVAPPAATAAPTVAQPPAADSARTGDGAVAPPPLPLPAAQAPPAAAAPVRPAPPPALSPAPPPALSASARAASAPPAQPAAPAASPSSRKGVLVMAAVLAVVVAGGGLAGWWWLASRTGPRAGEAPPISSQAPAAGAATASTSSSAPAGVPSTPETPAAPASQPASPGGQLTLEQAVAQSAAGSSSTPPPAASPLSGGRQAPDVPASPSAPAGESARAKDIAATRTPAAPAGRRPSAAAAPGDARADAGGDADVSKPARPAAGEATVTPRERVTEQLTDDTVATLAGRSQSAYGATQSGAMVAAVNRINWVLEQYAGALQRGDAGTFRRHRPSPNGLESQLLGARSVTIRLEDVSVQVEGAQATARARRTIDATLATGAALREQGAVTFALERRPTGWVITNVR